ncbi:MAG: RnfH family protein [Rhodospirillales bacterium]|nr:RnfH family protein [Desulfobacterales bacterium]MCU0895311.1 RnfH family protein [Rhodospirillales bacterium]
MADEPIEVEVAYARPDEQVILTVKVPPGTAIAEAIRLSGVLERFPEIDLAANKVGVFGKVGRLEQELAAGDRVEIYRALIADPKEARKQRAAEGKAMKKGAAALPDEG